MGSLGFELHSLSIFLTPFKDYFFLAER